MPPPIACHPFLGAHLSIATGLHVALEEAAHHRAGAVQIFSKSSGQWKAKPLEPDAVALFHATHAALGPLETAVHASYLINLASPDRDLLERSRAAFRTELERCEALGIPRLVFHPGAHMGQGENEGLRRVAVSLRRALRETRGFRTRIVIENTAGQGSCLGWRLEHLGRLLTEAGDPSRVRVCFDTCHLFAAGYDFRTESAYGELRHRIAQLVGLESIDLFHLNDSKRPLGSRVDRHEHIGQGFIGSRGFELWLRDPAFRGIPMVLETPKTEDGDRKNLARLRRLSRVPHGEPALVVGIEATADASPERNA